MRVMVSSDFTCFRYMTGIVLNAPHFRQRLVRLDAMPNYPMMFDVRELIWL